MSSFVTENIFVVVSDAEMGEEGCCSGCGGRERRATLSIVVVVVMVVSL